jgi:hypothetical protein
MDKMDAASVGKTPVSMLQELLIRHGIVPKYDLVQIEGAICSRPQVEPRSLNSSTVYVFRR